MLLSFGSGRATGSGGGLISEVAQGEAVCCSKSFRPQVVR